jgi:hypothetical protein
MRSRSFAWLASLCPAVALAYPIPPQTLWDLTRDAEVVVVAQVDAVERVSGADGSDPFESGDAATLRVTTTLKGPALGKVTVRFNAGIACPAPPVYRAGRQVLAFLTRARTGTGWVTTGLSYGTRYPADAREVEALSSVVRLALQQQRADPDPNVPPTAEWVLRAARFPVTRWDGLYAFDQRSDPNHAAYDRKRSARAPKGAGVEALEAALAEAFIAEPSYDSTLPMVLRVLEANASPAVTEAAVDAFETVLRSGSAPHWADEAMTLISERLGTPAQPEPAASDETLLALEVERARRGRAGPSVDEDSAAQLRWDTLKAQHRLHPHPRVDDARRPRTHTGGDSPL